ncbi:MAG TPA: hypothetical protein VFC19_53400 [Candidatus Limnocylindrales bacterium]|nr:hypothetical protein [Candidatus Limnocylindrales bacterium]
MGSVVSPMADEFYEKYKHLSHQELYRMLRAGMPRQVDGVGDGWATVASTLSGLADSLRQDMDRLLNGFAGSASNEVMEGLSALAQRAKTLAEEATAMRTGLTAMSQALALAKRQAEAPQEVPAALAQGVSFVLGAELGHVPTPEEQARARERMVWLVARLAAQYGIAEHANWPAVAALPIAIVGGAATVLHGHGYAHGQGHGHGDRHQRHGTLLAGATDLVRHHNLPASHVTPLPSGHNVVQPLGLTQTTAEAAGALRAAGAAPRAPSVHVVGSTPAVAMPSTDSPAATAAAAPPPPVGLGAGPGGMAPAGSVIGGSPAPGVSGPGGAPGGGLGLAGEVTWKAGDNLEWIDPDDAAPSVIGG